MTTTTDKLAAALEDILYHLKGHEPVDYCDLKSRARALEALAEYEAYKNIPVQDVDGMRQLPSASEAATANNRCKSCDGSHIQENAAVPQDVREAVEWLRREMRWEGDYLHQPCVRNRIETLIRAAQRQPETVTFKEACDMGIDAIDGSFIMDKYPNGLRIVKEKPHDQ